MKSNNDHALSFKHVSMEIDHAYSLHGVTPIIYIFILTTDMHPSGELLPILFFKLFFSGLLDPDVYEFIKKKIIKIIVIFTLIRKN